ncbi:MAG TPA: hypothetical protein VE076_01195 [Nitrososphaeraceae archaeon]|jgi:hypothetical protein|nr:hypothetical protein [Nitrososphaeraceae archaeon]
MTSGRNEKFKRCPICGCTEHRLIGCALHWRDHKRNNEGRCEIKIK